MAKSVLLVSDDEAFRSKVAILVNNRGFNYVAVENIEAARSALERLHFDLVLIDTDSGHLMDLKGFANKLHALGQKVLVALFGPLNWEGLRAPYILKAYFEAEFVGTWKYL